MMANKPLQSIKFPGLSDTYTTPQVDATLTTTGAAADAKKTGDEITSIKEDLSETSESVDGMSTPNILKTATLVTGYYINSSAVETSDANSEYYDYIPVEYGKYNLNVDVLNDSARAFSVRVIAYDANHENPKVIRYKEIAKSTASNEDITIYVDYPTAYIRISLYTYSRLNAVSLRRYIGSEYHTALDNVARKKIDVIESGLFEVVHANLIDKNKCIRGSMDLSTGIPLVRSDGTGEYISDFIPLKPNVGYKGTNIVRACYYNENKEFVSFGDYTAFKSTAGYFRLVIDVSKIDSCVFSYAENYDADASYDDIIYKNFTEDGNDFLESAIGTYVTQDNVRITKSQNLFDYDTFTFGFMYSIKGNNGNVSYASSKNNEIPENSNAYLGILDYIPVSPGQAVCVSHHCWNSSFYDDTKTFLQSAGEIAVNSFVVVPDGASYIRLNVHGSTNLTSNYIHSRSDMRNFCVWTVDNGETREPKQHVTLPMYQIDGKQISANYLDTVTPNMIDSPFISAMKCLTIREMNARDNAYRFGNLNTWVTLGTKGWDLIRKMLMDYGVDFCGFEEVAKGTAASPNTIAHFLKSWQFVDGFMSNYTDGVDPIDKSFVSRFGVISSTKFFTTSSGSSVAGLNCKVLLPRYNDVYNPRRTLSVYVVHLPITSNANKVSVANEIIAIMAQDTSDFMMVFGDTNDFADTEEGKLYWRTFETAGYRPVIPITTKTVTQDALTVVQDDPSQQWRHHSIDQFLVSSNITMLHYGVVNTKDAYGLQAGGTATDNEPALSDHDFVWVDLKFDYDTPRDNMPVIEPEETEEETGN